MKMIRNTTACLLASGWLMAVGCGGQSESAEPETPNNVVMLGTEAPAAGGAKEAPKAVNAGQCTTNELIDDLEDGNNQNVEVDMRGGYWYTYKDDAGSSVEPTGEFKPAEGGAEGSKHAARMHGKTGTGGILYVGLGITLVEPKSPYDASCCKGVSFWGKRDGEGIANVRLKVGDAQTTPEGGMCSECYNDFGSFYTFTNEWQKFEIMFADMKQESGWGEQKAAIDPATIYQLQWQVNQPNQAFDIWVDNVKFVGCSK